MTGAQARRAGTVVAVGVMILSGLLIVPATARAEQRFAVIVSGAPGGAKYAAQQRQWRSDLASLLTGTHAFPDANVVVLAEEGDGDSRSTAANVRRLFADLRRRIASGDILMLVLLGHGTIDGAAAKFNLVGPDLTAAEWNDLLAGIPGRLVIVNTTESSFPFLEELSKADRVVITATDSTAQRFATVFPEYFVKALADRTIDFDKDGRTSVWEAFAAASAAVKRHYEGRGQLSTERPLLDDDGDRHGREADAAGPDGALARTIFLDAGPSPPTSNPLTADLERRRAAVEAQIAQLKARKASLSQSEYAAELETLLVELARIARQIRERS